MSFKEIVVYCIVGLFLAVCFYSADFPAYTEITVGDVYGY